MSTAEDPWDCCQMPVCAALRASLCETPAPLVGADPADRYFDPVGGAAEPCEGSEFMAEDHCPGLLSGLRSLSLLLDAV